MQRFVLTATLNGKVNAHIIKANDTTDATFQAVEWILDNAYADKRGAWAIGAIKLYDPYGEIMHEMEAADA